MSHTVTQTQLQKFLNQLAYFFAYIDLGQTGRTSCNRDQQNNRTLSIISLEKTLNCYLLHMTPSNTSSATSTSNVNCQPTAPAINVFDI